MAHDARDTVAGPPGARRRRPPDDRDRDGTGRLATRVLALRSPAVPADVLRAGERRRHRAGPDRRGRAVLGVRRACPGPATIVVGLLGPDLDDEASALERGASGAKARIGSPCRSWYRRCECAGRPRGAGGADVRALVIAPEFQEVVGQGLDDLERWPAGRGASTSSRYETGAWSVLDRGRGRGLAARLGASTVPLTRVVDRRLGDPVGKAVGDALGAGTEFQTPEEIAQRSGEVSGLTSRASITASPRRVHRRHARWRCASWAATGTRACAARICWRRRSAVPGVARCPPAGYRQRHPGRADGLAPARAGRRDVELGAERLLGGWQRRPDAGGGLGGGRQSG